MLAVVSSARPATKQWQKFVAATDTAAQPSPPRQQSSTGVSQPAVPPPPPAAHDSTTTESKSSSKSQSAGVDDDEHKDEIDMKLQDFLAVSRAFCCLVLHCGSISAK